MSEKILEFKGMDFQKGLSFQSGFPLGGIYRQFSGIDPLELAGYAMPSLSATELTAPADSIKVLTSWQASSVPYVYAHTPTKLYQYLRNSPYTQTDVTAEIDVSPEGGSACAGAILWKDRYVYAHSVDLYSNTLPVASAENDLILDGSASDSLDIRKLCIGADGYLYVGDHGRVNKCISVDSTSGNVLGGFLIDTGFTVRDILNDGRFLVILADNNSIATTARQIGNYRCRVYFWDMAKATADVIYDIDDSYLIGGAILGGAIYFFGYNGMYVCNFATPPRLIFDMTGSSTILKKPGTPYQITTGKNSIYWASDTASSQFVYAYGGFAGHDKKILYSPYITHGSTYAHTALAYSSGALLAGVDAPKLYMHNVGATRGTGSILTASVSVGGLYRYDYAKVVLKEPLTTGQSVALSALSNNGQTVISDGVTKSYSASNPKKTLKFDLKPASGSESRFEDISLSMTLTAGATLERVCVYATSIGEGGQEI